MGDWRLGIPRSAPFDIRLERYMIPEPNSGCWIWIGALNGDGYGSFNGPDGKSTDAHTASYEHFVGQIPDGLELDHLCRVRCCVNPHHLEPVTRRENLARGINYHSSRTHCPKGHPYEGKNLMGTPKRRKCRICHNLTCNRARSERRRRQRDAQQTPNLAV